MNLSGIIEYGKEYGKNQETDQAKKSYISLSDKGLTTTSEKKDKLSLIQIDEKVQSAINDNMSIIKDLKLSDLIHMHTGISVLKDKLSKIKQQSFIKTFFLNIFSLGKYSKSIENSINNYNSITKKIEEGIDLKKSNIRKNISNEIKIIKDSKVGDEKKIEFFLDVINRYLSNMDLPLYRLREDKSIENLIDQEIESSEFFSSLPKEKLEEVKMKYQEMINNAYIQRNLNLAGKLVSGDPEEIQVIKYFNTNSLIDKKNVVKNIQSEISKLGPSIRQGSLEEFAKRVDQIALKVRLQAAFGKKLDPEQIEKFKTALHLFKQLYQSLINHAKNKKLEGIKLSQNSQNFKFIDSEFSDFKEIQVKKLVGIYFKKLNVFFEKTDLNNEQFKIVCKKVEEIKNDEINNNNSPFNKMIDSSNFQKNVKNVFDFFNKWGENLKVNLVQGFKDKESVFGGGICFGLIQHVQILNMKDPSLSIDSIAQKNEIKSIQRWLQGLHAGAMTLDSSALLPEKIGKKERVKEMSSFVIISDKMIEKKQLFQKYYDIEDSNNIISSKNGVTTDLIEEINKKLDIDDMTASNGWMRLGLEGASHTIALRLDKENNKAWIFDPNIGYLSFEAEGKNFQETQKECLACLADLLQSKYPEIYAISVSALQKI